MDDEKPYVTRDADGNLILVDPVAVAVAQVVEDHNEQVAKRNCLVTAALQWDRVTHFQRRSIERGMSSQDICIVLINVDSRYGRELTDICMPKEAQPDWQSIRNSGLAPFARGLVERPGFQEVLDNLDPWAASRMRLEEGIPVVVVDHNVIAVFSLGEIRDHKLT